MTIDTQQKVIAIQLRRFLTMIFFILVFLVVMFFLDDDEKYLGMKKKYLLITLTGLYLVSLIIELFIGYKYIFFNDDTNKIILRYFSLGYINRQKQSIEIPKGELSGYEIENSFFGMKKKIVLIRTVKTKEARYPAVSLTILSKKQIDQLVTTLDRYRTI